MGRLVGFLDSVLLRKRVGSSLFGLPVSDPAQAFAGEFDPVGVVNKPIQDGVGIGLVAEYRRAPPFLIG